MVLRQLEAGYAADKGKQVTLTCKKSNFENMHFDVSQVKTTLWNDEPDLEKRLKTRIEAMLGKSSLTVKNDFGINYMSSIQ